MWYARPAEFRSSKATRQLQPKLAVGEHIPREGRFVPNPTTQTQTQTYLINRLSILIEFEALDAQWNQMMDGREGEKDDPNHSTRNAAES